MPPKIEELLTRCESALKSRNFEDAISGCRAILNIAPDNVRAKEMLDDAQSKLEAELFVRENLRKAQDAFQNRDFQKCINECQKIQLLDPDNAAVRDLMKKSHEMLEAEPFIQNFITSGQSLFDSGLYGEAIAQWEKVRSIDPMFPGLDSMISTAREKMGGAAAMGSPLFNLAGGSAPELNLNFEPGADFGGLEPDQQRIQKLLEDGDQLAASGRTQEAIEVWSEIFMIDVSNTEALQRIESARNQPAGGAAAQPEEEEGSLQDLLAKGAEAESAGLYREAAQFFSQALAIDAENAELADRIKNLNLLAKKQDRGKTVLGNARAFMEEGKMESARHALSKILEADPENEEALEMMRELKGKGGAMPAAEGRPPAMPRPAKTSASLPVIPIAIVGAVLLLGGGGAFFLMRSKGNTTENIPKIAKVQKKIVPKPEAAPQPVAVISPEAREAAQRAAQEAQFYFQEKHDPEAIQKADEALKMDPGNQLAGEVKASAQKRIQDAVAAEKKILDDANNYFEYSDFAGAVKLYEKYVERHPETVNDIQPQIIKCYYNLGVISIRQWKCDTAGDYFRQVLFIDENDALSKDALELARKCQQVGSSDLEMRKQVTFLEMRK